VRTASWSPRSKATASRASSSPTTRSGRPIPSRPIPSHPTAPDERRPGRMSGRPTRAARAPRERVLVTGVRVTDMEGADPDEDLGEACGLVEAAEADVVGEL